MESNAKSPHSFRICVQCGSIHYVSIQVDIIRSEPDRVLARPSADVELIVSSAIILEPRFSIQFAAREFVTIAGVGVGLRHCLAKAFVSDRVLGNATGIDQA